MRSLHFLYTAYAATWIIHLTYIGILLKMAGRLRREFNEFKGTAFREK